MRFLNPGEGIIGIEPGCPPENLASKLFWTESEKKTENHFTNKMEASDDHKHNQ